MNQIVPLNSAAPEWMKTSRPAAALAALPRDSLADGIGRSYGIIGYKGKNWSLRYQGQVKMFTRPDDGTPASYIDAVILKAASHKSKSYYPSFEDGSSKPPVCASLDGIRPDPGVSQKQADTCALCPRNEFKTFPNGRKGRECSDYKRLAVLLMPNQTKPFFGQPLLEPVFLRVPADSLQALAGYGTQVEQFGYPYNAIVTRIKFDPKAPHPKFIFEPIAKVKDEEAPHVLELATGNLAQRIVGEVDEPHHEPPTEVMSALSVTPAEKRLATAELRNRVGEERNSMGYLEAYPEVPDRHFVHAPFRPTSTTTPTGGNAVLGPGGGTGNSDTVYVSGNAPSGDSGFHHTEEDVGPPLDDMDARIDELLKSGNGLIKTS
jgi:hypothetical protein